MLPGTLRAGKFFVRGYSEFGTHLAGKAGTIAKNWKREVFPNESKVLNLFFTMCQLIISFCITSNKIGGGLLNFRKLFTIPWFERLELRTLERVNLYLNFEHRTYQWLRSH
jgi:hypothetical protein